VPLQRTRQQRVGASSKLGLPKAHAVSNTVIKWDSQKAHEPIARFP
jgi:hypothetical protein